MIEMFLFILLHHKRNRFSIKLTIILSKADSEKDERTSSGDIHVTFGSITESD